MGDLCKHNPQNLFARHLVCKHCGKSIVCKNKMPIVIACIVAVLINVFVRLYLFEDPNLLVTSVAFIMITTICLIVGWLCLRFVGFEEKQNE